MHRFGHKLLNQLTQHLRLLLRHQVELEYKPTAGMLLKTRFGQDLGKSGERSGQRGEGGAGRFGHTRHEVAEARVQVRLRAQPLERLEVTRVPERGVT